jgi:hypothetical protein
MTKIVLYLQLYVICQITQHGAASDAKLTFFID